MFYSERGNLKSDGGTLTTRTDGNIMKYMLIKESN